MFLSCPKEYQKIKCKIFLYKIKYYHYLFSLDLENQANFSFSRDNVNAKVEENKNEVSLNSPKRIRKKKYIIKESLLSEKIQSKIVRKIITFRNKCNSEKKEKNGNAAQDIIFMKGSTENKINHSVEKPKKPLNHPLKEFLRKAFNSEKKENNGSTIEETKNEETNIDLLNKTETEKTKEELVLTTTIDHSDFIETEKENKGDFIQPSFLEKVYLEKQARRQKKILLEIKNDENKENMVQKNQNFIEVVTLHELKKKEMERSKSLRKKKHPKGQNK